MHVNPTYLMNVFRTQQQIADEIEIARTVYAKIKEIQKKIIEFAENPNMDIEQKYQFLAKKPRFLQDFSPSLYNVWNTSKINNEFKHYENSPKKDSL